MRTSFAAVIIAAMAVLASISVVHAKDARKTYYLLSHGGASDPFWVDWNAAAKKACRQLNVNCNISFSGGDMAAQKQAFNSALAAKPDGIATTSAQPGLWDDEVEAAKRAGIPVVLFNTDDPSAGRLAYVGANLTKVGTTWAKYLVDHKMVKKGDTIFLPVEVLGASYQQLETKGIAEIFDPLGIKYDVFDAGTDPAGIIAKMTNYMIANQPPAIIALGDTVAASVKRVFHNVGLKPSSIPVVGWGNSKETAAEVKEGYVTAAGWQYPSAQGFMPVALLDLATSGQPLGYDISTFSLYDKDNVGKILKIYQK